MTVEITGSEFQSARNKIHVDGDFVVPSGKSLKVETTPGGVEIFNEAPSAGKKWEVHIHMYIDEVDT